MNIEKHVVTDKHLSVSVLEDFVSKSGKLTFFYGIGPNNSNSQFEHQYGRDSIG